MYTCLELPPWPPSLQSGQQGRGSAEPKGKNETDSFSDQVTGGREVAAIKMEEERE